MRVFEGRYYGEGLKIAIVISRFNSAVTKELLDGALDALKRHEVKDENIDVIWVPGAMEIPHITRSIALKKKHDAIIALGAVIRGETYHFDVVANEVSKGIAAINLEVDVPVSFGIITSDTVEQALNRAGIKSGNKGFEAAMVALEMANLKRQIEAI
ncbi:6,7-dimethyl-8-ribityllumazine synthase [Kosmotoga olearia]|uniref:6,7-dimethyl-8-ribityllumazine synthase n=1 Tax=Kosmotoga olearia (strain ATCC BAA-1733 / DSM 21960 / TBF 19.5.1) TaxID=521045 RepID=RISB_KOSOT|nr:6,7-dimethyl-8-ribityllumazine synthase [Kosmotoga olearia]C5CJ15.1 RecName: Full=6,7-dimethyl-8-ribityllumazine synthase; Short=DMRL synthase; Short=LS; Short=Lumazine synthase [Kosmotoga olearia TBF 19.5.1]ACR79931.1 6,7-dimethyl-8-ribityllumazine synthase [Kosmotoga olearia TBF 19.5.1]MDK2953752.1 6,7-dimethyl-8-ribityllumazine synthase [Kosmotoga sp.]